MNLFGEQAESVKVKDDGQKERGLSIVFNQDCMEVMAKYPDGYFDLAVVDPPYGINRSGQTETFTKDPNHKRKGFVNKGWDKEKPTKKYWGELFRVSKNQIVFGANYFVEHIKPSMGWIVWDKGQKLSMSDGELIYTSFDRALRIVVVNRGFLAIEGVTFHPTQKPIKLYDWIFKNYAEDGMKILDTHLGSGSSRISAYKAGLDFTGCELDKEYFEAQEKRFKNFISQQTLF